MSANARFDDRGSNPTHRALENGEVRRVGASTVEYPNVRIVAATNRNLSAMVQEGSFREDLFFRLEVLSVKLPSLRERKEDIPLLANEICKSLDSECRIAPDAANRLLEHHWPGNIRELRNVLTRGFVLGGSRIEHSDIELYVSNKPDFLDSKATEKNEKNYFRSLSQKHNGNRSAMARELGIPRTTLLYKLQRLGLVDSK